MNKTQIKRDGYVFFRNLKELKLTLNFRNLVTKPNKEPERWMTNSGQLVAVAASQTSGGQRPCLQGQRQDSSGNKSKLKHQQRLFLPFLYLISWNYVKAPCKENCRIVVYKILVDTHTYIQLLLDKIKFLNKNHNCQIKLIQYLSLHISQLCRSNGPIIL